MTLDKTKIKPGHQTHWYNRQLLPVYDSGSETGNSVLTMDHPMRELFISNDDDSSDITINVAGEASLSLDFVLKPKETLNERFPEFLIVTVVSGGDWRWFVRSGLIS
jgi:hypothetical protein